MNEQRIRELIREEMASTMAHVFQKHIQLLDGRNIVIGTTTGTKIATETTQKIGFYGKTPVAQQTTAIDEAAFSELSGTTVNDNTTFGGYTIRQVVKALQLLGLLA